MKKPVRRFETVPLTVALTSVVLDSEAMTVNQAPVKAALRSRSTQDSPRALDPLPQRMRNRVGRRRTQR